MKKNRTSRLTWREDFYAEHRVKQTLVVVCPRDVRHTVGEIRSETPADAQGWVWPLPDDRAARHTVGVLEFVGEGNDRIHWVCCHCYRAGRRDDNNILRSQRLIALLAVMKERGPGHLTVVLSVAALDQAFAELTTQANSS